MELLREHEWRSVMESKQLFWNAVGAVIFTVLLLGFGLITLVRASRRLLIRFQWRGASNQTPVEQSK